MLDEASAGPIIERALMRLTVAPAERHAFVDRILSVSVLASFRPPPPGKRVTPKQIVLALERVERGLRDVSAGLHVIDNALSTAGMNAKKRRESLATVQRASLGAIAQAVLNAVKDHSVTEEGLAASMPEYGYLSFTNIWRGVFSNAAHQVSAVRAAYDQGDFRAPTNDQSEWFVRAIGQLAEIYEDATGRKATSYSPGSDVTNPGWHPPFSQFVIDLWPLLRFGNEKPPSDRRISDALASAPKLPPMRTTE